MADRPESYGEPPQPRIETSTMQLMVIVAFGFDVFQGAVAVLPIAGIVLAPIVGFFAWLTFFVWLKVHDIALSENIARMILINGGFLIELVPLVNIIPFWTLSVAVSLLLVERDDRRRLDAFLTTINTRN